MIGFVGLGTMGTPMVERLAGAGESVLAYDVDPSRAAELARHRNVTAAAALSDLGDVRLVVLMLPNSDVVEEVTTGAGGLFEVLEQGALIVDMGSSVPRRTIELSRRAQEVGLELVDAPVSGGLVRARTGELTAMFGGTADQLERCRPVLDTTTAKVVHMGSVGSGHAMKALNNVMSATGLTIACEVVEVGRRFGLDPDLMIEVLNGSTGRNHATETKMRQFVLSETFDSGFLLRLMLKDLTIAADLAADVGAMTPLADSCLELWSEAADLLPADADQTRIAELPARPRERTP